MLKYEPEVHELAQKMCNKLLRLTESGQIMNVADPFNCFTADTISQYCFGESFGCPHLKSNDSRIVANVQLSQDFSIDLILNGVSRRHFKLLSILAMSSVIFQSCGT